MLKSFQTKPFPEALQELFKELNLPLQSMTNAPLDRNHKYTKELYDADTLIDKVYYGGVLDDKAFEGAATTTLDDIAQADDQEQDKDYKALPIFGVTLHPRDNNRLPTRTQLSEISRAFNRAFPYMPVLIVFAYKDAKDQQYIALSNTERTAYQQKWRDGEKAGKVTLLRDINTQNPHRGHLDILQRMDIGKGKKKIKTFQGVYEHWQAVLNVSLLNKKFYEELSNWYFWAVKNVTFPNAPSDQDEAHNHNAQNIIRLLTRLLFSWFIKQKGLIPDAMFDLESLQDKYLKEIDHDKEESIYYKAILQNLFFASLNCPIEPEEGDDKRKRGFRKLDNRGQHRGVYFLMRYQKYFKDSQQFLDDINKVVPFLNGGLFECLDDHDTKTYIDGFSDNLQDTLSVPDYLFFGEDATVDLSEEYNDKKQRNSKIRGLIHILNDYKFTIAENTPLDEEVALDPELLGRVFENLLASYNPETKESARKQSGSYYTPREIVNYMVDESLIAYLVNALKAWYSDDKGVENETQKAYLDIRLHNLCSYEYIIQDKDSPLGLSTDQKKEIIQHLGACTILDPACGSGAFPMGILHKMVFVLERLDPDNKLWRALQVENAQKQSDAAFEDAITREERAARLDEINTVFTHNTNYPNYARKLFLIENCIYGVDLQPIAIQISKLRFFISLIVDQENSTDPSSNFNIRPLPNLETKFVAANTLIGLGDEAYGLFKTDEIKTLEHQLKSVRHKIYNAKSPKTKREYKKRDKDLRAQIADLLKEKGISSSVSDKLALWDPYDQNTSAAFFDPDWMYGVDRFDVVIGNPPYLDYRSINKTITNSSSFNFCIPKDRPNLYLYFIEKCLCFLDQNGGLTFINPITFLASMSGCKIRKHLINNFDLTFFKDVSHISVFENAQTYPTIWQVENSKKISNIKVGKVHSLDHLNKVDFTIKQSEIHTTDKLFLIPTNSHFNILNKIEYGRKNLRSCLNSDKDFFWGSSKSGFSKSTLPLAEYENTENKSEYAPLLATKDVKRYHIDWKYLFVNKNIYSDKVKAKFDCEKIVIARMTKRVQATIVDKSYYVGKSSVITNQNGIKNEVLVMILNSQLIDFWFKIKFEAKHLSGEYISFDPPYLSHVPIEFPTKDVSKLFVNLYCIHIVAFSFNDITMM